MRKGAQGYTIRDHLKDRAEIERSMKRIKAIGYDCVQVGGLPISDQELKAMLDGLGLHCCTSSGNYDAMLAGADGIKDAVTGARLFGTNLIAIASMPEPFRDSEDGFKRYAETLNIIAAALGNEGCKLNYHPHSFEFLTFGGGRNGMDVLLGETDPDNVYFMLDTHWLAGAGVNPPDWIRKAGGRMPVVHFKDYAVVSGAQSLEGISKAYAEVGEGNLNWPAIIEACRDINVQYAVVEQDTCKGDPFDSLSVSYANMVRFGM